MNLSWIRPMLIRSKQWLFRNAPHLLMAAGTGSAVSSVIFAVQARPKADYLVREAKREKNTREGTGDYIEDLTTFEKVKAAAPAYIPAVGMELFSLLCFWSAHGIDVRRQAVLAGLYSTAEQALIEYQKKVVEMIGEKPEKEIRTAIAQDQMDKNPLPTMLLEPDTDVWCMYKGYRFRNNYRKLKDTQNDANYELINHLYLSESDLLWMFDPDRRYVVPSQESRMIGWSVDRLLEFDILPCMTPDHQPALKVEIRDKDGREYLPQPGYSASL